MVGNGLEREKKNLKVEVFNHELNALEDLLTLDYENHEDSKEKDADAVMNLWKRLVEEWEKVS